jgi:hypothetical protein
MVVAGIESYTRPLAFFRFYLEPDGAMSHHRP